MSKTKAFSLTFLFLLTTFITYAFPSFPEDSVNRFVIKKIVLIGNKRTVDCILYRELIFHVGDTLSTDDLDIAIGKSTENLNNTLLFNKVDIQRINDREGLLRS